MVVFLELVDDDNYPVVRRERQKERLGYSYALYTPYSLGSKEATWSFPTNREKMVNGVEKKQFTPSGRRYTLWQIRFLSNQNEMNDRGNLNFKWWHLLKHSDMVISADQMCTGRNMLNGEKKWWSCGSSRVGGLEHVLFSHILGIIIPID